MKMNAADIIKFPKLHYYVRVDMPKVSNSTAIVSAMKRYAGDTSRKTIKDALRWGMGPTIEILDNLVCAGVQAYGCYTWGGEILQIDKSLVDDFEAGKGVVKNSNGNRVYLVGATLLHELTHWADAKDGVDHHDPSLEEGNAFEKAVYGKILG